MKLATVGQESLMYFKWVSARQALTTMTKENAVLSTSSVLLLRRGLEESRFIEIVRNLEQKTYM